MEEDIVFSRKRHIGLITLKRVPALHALTRPMIIALQLQLSDWQQDSDIHAVVIQAEPCKAFCAGGDVRWIYDAKGKAEQLQFFWHEYRLNYFIHQFDKPYIALMDGITMGGGVGISLHGSHPVASERFVFAMPETGIGFFPDIGASYLLSRCPGYAGLYLGLTGNRLGPMDAYALGMVKQVVLSHQFQNVLNALIETDLSTDPHHRVDECLKGFSMPLTPGPIMSLEKQICRSFNQKDIDAIIAALAVMDDDWGYQTLSILQNKAPLSLKVTLAQLQKAKSMTMAECIKMDYCLVGHFIRADDFYEGVRALLVDKDKTPHWNPETLRAVTADMVLDYFICGQPELPLLS